jgi:hypothetical protein
MEPIMKTRLLPAFALLMATGLPLSSVMAQDGLYVPSQDTKANQKALKAASVANAKRAAKEALRKKKDARTALADTMAARSRSKAPIGSKEYADLANQETDARSALDEAIDLRKKQKKVLANRKKEKLGPFLARKDADFAREWQRSQAAAAGIANKLPSIPANIDNRQPGGPILAGAGAVPLPLQGAPRFNRAPVVYGQLPPERARNYVQLPPEPSGQGQRQDYTGKVPVAPATKTSTPIYDRVPPIGPGSPSGPSPAAPLPPPFAPTQAAAGNINYGLLPSAKPVQVQRLKFNDVQPALRSAINRAEQASPSGPAQAYERK